jgi:hypothetical protein
MVGNPLSFNMSSSGLQERLSLSGVSGCSARERKTYNELELERLTRNVQSRSLL